MLGERFENFSHGVISNLKHGIDPFKFCKKDLISSDLNVANLECVVSSESNKKYPFSKFMIVEENQLDLLVKNNVKILNIANNHIFDHGEKAFFKTRENLEEKGIQYFGFDEKMGLQKVPLLINIEEITLAFLGYDLSNLNKKEFVDKLDTIIEILKNINKDFNYLILSLHWGYEYSESPTSLMIKAAKKLFEYGADIIYGHHPHILQGITKLNNKIFAPSLGNFIFDDEREKNRFTGILSISLNQKNILDYELYPYFCNENYQPIPDYLLKNRFLLLKEELEKNIINVINNNCEFDNKIFMDSEAGHIKNKKRVRKKFLSNFHLYLPFLPQILKQKLIDKRLRIYLTRLIGEK